VPKINRLIWAESFLENESASAERPAGYDSAIVGVATVPGAQPVIAYSVEAMIGALQKADPTMTRGQALEHLYQTVLDAYVGPGTPSYIWEPPEEE